MFHDRSHDLDNFHHDLDHDFPPEEVRLDDVELVHETEKAILVRYEGEDYWIPKSQVLDFGVMEPGQTGYLVIPEWLAEDKEMI